MRKTFIHLFFSAPEVNFPTTLGLALFGSIAIGADIFANGVTLQVIVITVFLLTGVIFRGFHYKRV